MSQTTDTILVWGAGAIGGTVGAYLARGGRDVLFVDSAEDHVAAMNAGGLAIEGPIETFSVAAPASLPAQVGGRFRRILLCVKAHHTAAAAEALTPHLAEDGVVVSLQNGLNERVIAGVVGERRTIGAFVNFGADYLAPGRVLYGGRGAFVLGELDGAMSPRLQALVELARVMEPGAVASDNIWGFLWGKLGYGALLFATALTDDSIADVLDAPEFRPLLVALAREVVAVSAAQGIRPEGFNGWDPTAFAPDAPQAAADASFAAMVAFNRRSAKSHSGIWRDLAVRRRRTEVDAQIGPVVTEAARIGLPAPLSERLVTLIHDIEEGRLTLARDTLRLLGRER